MWIFKKNLEKMLSGEGDIDTLKKQIRELKDELAELKTTKKMETREIEHLVKLKEEKLSIEHQKRTVELLGEFGKKEMVLQTEYHDKIMKALDASKSDMISIHKEILKRLPNVSVLLGEKPEGKKKK